MSRRLCASTWCSWRAQHCTPGWQLPGTSASSLGTWVQVGSPECWAVAQRPQNASCSWKRRAWRRGKEGQREPGGPNESRRNMDMDVPEPPNVITARESFMALVEEQGRLQEQKVRDPQLQHPQLNPTSAGS